MKLLIAMMSHETNTFSPVPTPLTRFGNGAAPPEGDEALFEISGRALAMGGMLAVAQAAGAEIVTPIAAGAPPSGPVDDGAYEYICNLICEQAAGCDGVLLELHGAMVTETLEDGEGTLLTRLRQLYPDMPIGVALDMHANVYPAMVDNSTIITGFQTYPHIDMFQTGERAARALLAFMRGEIQPVTRWGNCPMLPHVMRQGTDDMPNKALQQRVVEMEAGDAVAVSLFTGFPHADIYNAGLSVVVTTDNDPALAEALRDELLEMAWAQRAAFVYQVTPLPDAVAAAETAANASGDGPVILLDHYDNTASGGTMDTTEVLREILRQGLEDVAVFAIYDPIAVAELIAVGVGQDATVNLGARFHLDALAQQSRPLTVSGRVRLISDGKFVVSGPMGTGSAINMGATVVLDTGNVQIIVISRHFEPYDLGCFTSLGIDPLKKRFLMLKSRIHYRATFKPIAKELIECAGLGVCTSDYDQLKFRHVRRPIYPLDNINSDKLSQGFPQDS
ncbi:MAG: M81 family metallopeptidase [SAR86 cluster bacterium]|mgnify:FL=1|jgi:microcystin degradation protein MlrC|uniref:Microcystinase C n=1 Tax=SAR86 cluster bacterium TaxID=2030880 RepID=A0A973A933_9GAMM|nr:M81 family metallopeptidase [SAR86 cluster bacterium]|tara:strand:+ start:9476 stop:10993 length:1518 start_codon:yes stop_codon:yes gene_type:complete